MDKIKAQADKLWQLISNPSTGAAYQQTLALTWTILKETGLLLWLIICLVLVLGDWFWQYSFTTGQNTRTWLNQLQTKSAIATANGEGEASGGNFWSETGKSLLTAGQSSVNAALSTAREQLGIAAPPAPAPTAPAPATPKPAPTPAEMSPLAVNEPVMNEPKVPPTDPLTSSENSVILMEEGQE